MEFKKRYISDPEFKQEDDFYKNVKKVAGAVDDENFKVTLQCFESEFSRRRSIRPTDPNKDIYSYCSGICDWI